MQTNCNIMAEPAAPVQEAYQVMGVVLLGDARDWTDEDAERALDNILAAANGKTFAHPNFLPWPEGSQ